MSKSQWDGSGLSSLWLAQPSTLKSQVIAHLQGRTLMPPYWWQRMSQEERRAVVLHLCAVGSVSYNHKRVRLAAGKDALYATNKFQQRPVIMDVETSYGSNPILKNLQAWRDAHPQVTKYWFEESTKIQPMLYPNPNGGQRTLPSVYTKLTDRWLRANGVYNEPAKMNQGHLKNCVALLNESHINLVDKMVAILGRMHNHLGNRPDLQAKLVSLFEDFEALTVDELYPIVELLASHIVPEPTRLQMDPNTGDPEWVDDASYPF